MRTVLLPKLLFFIALILLLFSSCVDDKYLIAPPPIADQSFVEEFDTISGAYSRGWKIINTSNPMISNIWQQGGSIPPFFEAYSSNGSYVGFIGISAFVSNPAVKVISQWLISPPVTLQNGDKIIFYTRGWLVNNGRGDSTDYGNRLQVRLNANNDSLKVGSGIDVGDFNLSLLDINPKYNVALISKPDPLAFPGNWTRFEATIDGLQQPVKGRFAFRYFIEDGLNFGSGIGIDRVAYKSVGH